MIQPVRQNVAITADATGAATATFQSIPQGMVWTGSINVAGAPGPAQFTVLVSGLGWGNFSGPNPYGPVQAGSRDTITVEAIGLAPNTTYNVGFIGAAVFEGDAEPAFPSASPGGIVTAGNLAASVLVIGPAVNGVLVPAPAANMSIVVYTLSMAIDDTTATLAVACNVASVGLMYLRGQHIQPAFGYYGGFVCPPGQGISVQCAGVPAGITVRAGITYQLIPAGT